MTTFAELYALTVVHTQRPELVALTESAVRTATLRAHHTDFFRKDLKAAALDYTISVSVPFQDFPDVSASLLPRLRSIKDIYGMSVDGLHKVEQLEYRETDDLYDADGCARHHTYTLLGDTLRCYFCAPTGKAEVYFFANPVVTSGSYSSWIADEYPDDLAAWAAAIVMSRTGFLDMAASYQRDFIKPFKESLIASHLLATVA